MRKEISVTETGKSVEEAIDRACLALGHSREECVWEIIDLPAKKFFGLKTIPAKVRVSIEVPEDEREEPKTVPEAKPKPIVQRKPMEKPQHKKETLGRDKQKADKKKPEPKIEAAIKQKEVPVVAPRPAENKTGAFVEVSPEKMKLAVDYVQLVVDKMQLTATVSGKATESGLYISIEGENLGAVIGRRGDTLDALQYLAGLVANRLGGDYLRVTVDCGNYRLKREETLVALAKRMATQVLKTNTNKTLEPMNPAERRIVHATVAEISGVTSHSVGTEPNRRVIIKSPNSKGRPPRRGSRPTGNNNRGNAPKNDVPKEIQQEIKPATTEKAEVVKDTPLYGKVDLD